MGEQELENLSEKRGKKYPVVIDSWKRNWIKLSTNFKYTAQNKKTCLYQLYFQGYHAKSEK